MRYGFRWVAALLVLALLVPAAAGAQSAAKSSPAFWAWNPFSRVVAFVSNLFDAVQHSLTQPPLSDDGGGYDPNGTPK